MSNETTSAPANPDGPARRRLPAWMTNFGYQVIAGLILGVVLGLISRGMSADNGLESTLSWIGGAYVQLLKLLIPALVFTAVVTSISNLRQVRGAAQLAVSTLMWFAVTAFFSVTVGIFVGLILRPGEGADVDASAAVAPEDSGSWLGFIESLIPSNLLGLSASSGDEGISLSFNVLQILVVSLLFGIAAVRTGKAAEPFIEFSASFLKIIQEVLWWVIRLAPVGTAALIGNAVSSYGWEALSSLGKFVLAIYIGLGIVIFGIYPAVLKANGLGVRAFFRRVWPVTSLGFVTRSSMGVMPVTHRITEENLGVPREYASFAVPLGATTKMDGCAAIYPAIASLFVAQFYGIDLYFGQYLLIIFVSVIGSAATAGTTGATVMLTLTLSTLGLPLEGVGLLLAIEPIIDMGRTAVNVTGQALIPAVVAKRAGILNHETWEHALDENDAAKDSSAVDSLASQQAR